MTAEAGIQDAFVFGGPKSKLRSLASPYSAGRAFVYFDPPRDFRKLSDFEVRESFSGLRESLRKLWAAALVAEFLIKTSGGGGDFPQVLALALETLRGLESLPEEKADYPAILFLWRMIALLGLMPDPGSCASCGADLAPGGPMSHAFAAGGFLCPDCARAEAERGAFAAEERGGYAAGGYAQGGAGRDGRFAGGRGATGRNDGGASDSGLIPISAGAARWLERASRLPFAEALGASLDGPSLAGLKRLAFGLARRAAEAPLTTLTSGAGIL
jgi:predicted RNA-binding Zn-ribbon protein involved in translation (DUF1610 family)